MKVMYHDAECPHQSLGISPPAERFAMAAEADLEVVGPLAALATVGNGGLVSTSL